MTAEITTTTDALARLKRAVIYLRVSTVGQVKTDRDAEGFSIPAQREACLRKAESLGAMVLDEYVDAGESARTADRAQLGASPSTWPSAKPAHRSSACPRTSTKRPAACCCTAS